MYTIATSSSIGDGASYYTVFDPKRDNVIAVGIPTNQAFKNHNYAKFRVLTNGKLFCSDAHLGYTPNGNVTLKAEDTGSGWIVTANTIYSNGLIATETENKDDKGNVISTTITYKPSTAEADRFTLSTIDFSRSINGTSRSNLRLAIGQNFAVSGAGYVYAKGSNIANGSFSYMKASNATINTATISTATITNATLSGTITGTEWNITSDGKATFNNVNMVTGKLGNWTFATNSITNDNGQGVINLGSSGNLNFGTHSMTLQSYWIYTDVGISCEDISFHGTRKVKKSLEEHDDEIYNLWGAIEELWEAI